MTKRRSSLPHDRKRTRARMTRFSVPEDKVIVQRAKDAGVTIAAYLRDKALA